MIKVKIEGLDKTLAHLAGMQKQVRYATAVALTRTAKRAQAATADEMRSKFDRPTRTTMKSMFVKPATKANLEAMVYVKDKPFGGKNPFSMAELLKHQFTGGSRIAKQLELILRRDGFLLAGEFVVPGAAAKLDSYGNMNRGQIVQILSQIGVRTAGYDSSPTKSKRSRRNVARAGQIFWSAGTTGNIGKVTQHFDKAGNFAYTTQEGRGGKVSHLPKGAWMRAGRSVKPLMIVIKSQRYRQRINLDRIARQAIDRHFNAEFDQAFADAMRTAR